MKKILFSSVILATLANAGGSIEGVYEPIVVEPEPIIEYKHSMVYIRMGMASVNTQSSTTENITFSSDTLDTSASMIDVGVNYKFTPNVYLGLEYQSMFLSIANIQNFLASINYEFDMENFRPYMGLLYGASTLEWTSNPDTVLIDKNLKSTSPVYGAQIGLKKEIREDVFVTGTYQVLSFDHELDIRENRSNITHTLSNNFMLGVQYEF